MILRFLRVQLAQILFYLKNFNTFPSVPPTTDHHTFRTQVISTRIFIITFISCLSVLIFYSSTITINKTVTVKTPTVTQYLQLFDRYPQLLSCPCRQIAIMHEKFIQIDYTLHQVCQSSFISQQWIEYLYQVWLRDTDHLDDFRRMASLIFQGLAVLCRLVEETIDFSLSRFYTSEYTSGHLISPNDLELTAKTAVDDFETKITSEFLLSLRMIRDTTHGNSLLSTIPSNAHVDAAGEGYSLIRFFDYDGCSCLKSSKCRTSAKIYSNRTSGSFFTVPMMYMGCYVLEALLQSSLTCFYDESCLHDVEFHLGSSMPSNIIPIAFDSSSQFNIDSTVETLVEKLMVETWTWSTSFENYFNVCSPSECTYSYSHQNDFVFMFTLIIGIVGSLMTILKIIVPTSVALFRRKRIKPLQSNATASRSVKHHISSLTKYLWDFNLFPSIPPSTDQHELKVQRISTRVFIIALVSSFIFLIVYTSLVTITKTVVIKAPTLDVYWQLYEKYSQSLNCPCRQIAIPYRDFIQVRALLHQVCFSSFISPEWIEYLVIHTRIPPGYLPDNFEPIAPFIFQTLGTTCELVIESITTNLIQFQTGQFNSFNLIPGASLHLQAESIFEQFRQKILKEFRLSMRMIRETMHVNQLVSASQSNGHLVFLPSLGRYIIIPAMYGSCNCALNYSCSRSALFYNDNFQYPSYVFSHISVGCHVIEGLLQSTLECLYSDACISQIAELYRSPLPETVERLDSTELNRFLTSSTVGQLLDELMVERWMWSISFARYFDSCEPIECSYTYITTNGALYIFVLLISIIGGLITILMNIVPMIVNLLFSKKTSTGTNNITMRNWCCQRQCLLAFGRRLWRVNFFPSIIPTTNPQDLRIQIISTRIFIVAFIGSLCILVFYSSFIPISRKLTVRTPTLGQYYKLFADYPQSLSCPCDRIAITQQEFIEIDYTLHPLCESNFVNQQWIELLYVIFGGSNIENSDDFMLHSTSIFQGLASLCSLAKATIDSAISQFVQNSYKTLTLVSSSKFITEIQALLVEFESNMNEKFFSSIRMIRETTYINNILTVRGSNAHLTSLNNSMGVRPYFLNYGECSCMRQPSCISPVYFRSNSINEETYRVPMIYVGCYVLEALLQSSLVCLYDSICVDHIRRFIIGSPMSTLTPLRLSSTTRFSTNDSLEILLDKLMVESWIQSISYEGYFSACRPIECTYSSRIRGDWIYIVTTILGLWGGLISSYELLVPYSIKLLFYLLKKMKTMCRNRVANQEHNDTGRI